MKKTLVLPSVTYALKAQELLRLQGIYSVLTRSGEVRSVKGCGYGICIDESHCERTQNILSSAGIKIHGII